MKKILFIIIVLCFISGCTILDEPLCSIRDLEVTPIECQSDSTYNLSLNFVYSNAGNEYFEIFGRENTPLGYYSLADLPLNIEQFKKSGNEYNFIKICINDNPDCCIEHEFLTPDCSDKTCEIRDLSITPGDCVSDGKYKLSIDFIHENTDNEHFDIFGRNDTLLGSYKLTDLPITIEDFETSGKEYDFVKICINDNKECCAVHEFLAPDCSEKACEIRDLSVTTGECITDGKYNLTINFIHENATNEYFDVYGNGNESLGYYKLADLPITIENYKTSGNDYDRIKVCINDNSDCCAVNEFLAPDCSEKACEIRDLSVTTGDCITGGKYNLTINFIHENANNEYIEVYGNGNVALGSYKLADLPLTLENYETSGNDYDRIKVCINDNADCCSVNEFPAPDCSDKACEIWDLELTAGECVTDSTYNLTINFEHKNTNNNLFEVFTRNNNYVGIFELSSLPLTISDFKKSGLEYDFIRIAINDNPNCSKAFEIKSPTCE